MNFPPCTSHNIPPSTESYASPTTRGSFSPCSSCFTPTNTFYTFPQTWCSEEDLPTPSSTLPSPPRHASCQHIQNESRVLFNQWWTQTSDMTFLERVEAKRTRDFPQDFVDPATTPEPSPKKPRTLEPPVQGSSSQATTRAAEAAEQRMQDEPPLKKLRRTHRVLHQISRSPKKHHPPNGTAVIGLHRRLYPQALPPPPSLDLRPRCCLLLRLPQVLQPLQLPRLHPPGG